MKPWFQQLDVSEQTRRQAFTAQFSSARQAFAKLPLSEARNISVHRSGIADVTVATTGLFGVAYIGGPTKPIPISETRQIDDPSLAFLATSLPVRPIWSDFYFDNQTLHPICKDYLDQAQALITDARTLVTQVHGTNSLTLLPGMKP
jgi:hypothetical protein